VSSGDRLKRAAVSQAALVEVITDDFAAELGEVLTLLTAKIRRLVRELQTTTTGRIAATEQNLALAVRLRADLGQALDQAGYHTLAFRAIDAPLDRLAAQLVASQTIEPFALDVDALVALKDVRLAELLQVGDDIAVQLWRVMVDGVVGARPVLDLVDDVADVLDISDTYAQSVYDTLTATYSRQVGLIGTTGEGDEAFLYVGPDDHRTRPFCAEHVDQVFSRDAIDAMDNGQRSSVWTSGGGVNCRHRWARVSALDTDLLDLVDGGTRYQDRNALVDDELDGDV
jgi:hypothetical protein